MSDVRRVNFDLPTHVVTVVDRLAEERGLTRAGLFRQAVGVLQVMHDGAKEGYLTGTSKDRQKLDQVLVAPL